MTSATKTCGTCGESRPLTEFRRRKASPDGHADECKACRVGGNGKGEPVNGANRLPSFIECAETYLVKAEDGTSVALTAQHLDELCAWWRAKTRRVPNH